MQLWSRPAKTLPIELNGQAIVDSLTEINKRRVWANRVVRDDELYIVQVEGIPGVSLPTTLVVKKCQNVNLAPQVDDNVKYRYNSEMFLLASNSHDNIIKVIDLIQQEDAIMLVYEYPVNGGLDYWLHQAMDAGRALSWPERRVIAIGTAKGLCHMHHGCKKPIIHHNINSNNILLDRNFKPVIASFDAAQMNMAGLDQPLPIAGFPLGNFGYSAPEYGVAASELTEKVDTYSFGVLMLELVTGRLANEFGADGHLATWARKNFTKLMANQQEMFQSAVDRDIPDQARYMEEIATVFMLGVDCTVGNPQQRPSMRMALKRLRRGYGRVGPFHGLLTCYLL
ncbi:unnamed protein product [Triticum turgidum subsp. durum]|uniref:Protein kinase domain-containing protein n=1 Tax=Triticum turgidum subsp. durum TaxID=4567 RepID=A0A9R0W7F2_TRITD|nr:unnamed protein product [Triticum turgidum subsp. durum]